MKAQEPIDLEAGVDEGQASHDWRRWYRGVWQAHQQYLNASLSLYQRYMDNQGLLLCTVGQMGWEPYDTTEVEVVDSAVLSKDQLQLLADGRVAECFGRDFTRCDAHVRTPRLPQSDSLFLEGMTIHRVADGTEPGAVVLQVACDFQRRSSDLAGTERDLLNRVETASLQALAAYMIQAGQTLDHDGWRFEQTSGFQATQGSLAWLREYPVVAMEMHLHPAEYRVRANVCVTGGVHTWQGEGFAAALVPDWPLRDHPELMNIEDDVPAFSDGEIVFNRLAMAEFSLGRPSRALGSRYQAFDTERQFSRLPGPAYQCLSRICDVEVPDPGDTDRKLKVVAEYDVPPDAWYFAANGGTLPFCILLETALQPCGWLALYVGVPLESNKDRWFRNLDGSSVQYRTLRPDVGTIRTEATLVSQSRFMDTWIGTYEITCTARGEVVFRAEATFGYFTRQDLARQVGLPTTDEERDRLHEASSAPVSLPVPGQHGSEPPLLLQSDLLMIDRVSGYWPEGGRFGLGRIRGEKQVRPSDWFFKAHFYTDPVQPGSLGIEAMIQLLKCFSLQKSLHAGIPDPVFAHVSTQSCEWTYRGQVLPTNGQITVDLEVSSIERSASGVTVMADGTLWVDGKKIYRVHNLGIRLANQADEWGEAPVGTSDGGGEIIDPAVQTWLNDHCPTYTAPALPFMFMVDRLAAAALATRPGAVVIGLEQVQVNNWLVCDKPRHLRTEVAPNPDNPDALDVTLLCWRDALTEALSRYEPIAQGRVLLGSGYPGAVPCAPLERLIDPSDDGHPYQAGRMMHGPTFQVVQEISYGRNGADYTLDASIRSVPKGCLNQLLLDGLTHGIPNHRLNLAFPELSEAYVVFPKAIEWARIHRPIPDAGTVSCELRPDGFFGGEKFPAFRVRMYQGDRDILTLRLVGVLFPKGVLAEVDLADLRRFLRDRVYVPNVHLSVWDGATTRLQLADVKSFDWFPGTVNAVYATGERLPALGRTVAVKEHVARKEQVHPRFVTVSEEGDRAWSERNPLVQYHLATAAEGGQIQVSDRGRPVRDVSRLVGFWQAYAGAPSGWLVDDLMTGLIEVMTRRVQILDPAGLEGQRGKPVIFMANHQTAIESMWFLYLAAALHRTPVMAVSKAEHRDSWVGQLVDAMAHPSVRLSELLVYFQQQDGLSLIPLLEQLGNQVRETGHSVLIHVEGARMYSARDVVRNISAGLVDFAMNEGLPIVPVWFGGGLPVRPVQELLDVPAGLAPQDVFFGSPIDPQQLRDRHLLDRKKLILEAINQTGAVSRTGGLNRANKALAADVSRLVGRWNMDPAYALLVAGLLALRHPGPDAVQLLQGLQDGVLRLQGDAHGRWLGHVAELLYGPGGPRVVFVD
ncbi:MAG: polyketide synthase dehydratase domain-containing protein [Alicyclobacillus sp.]|nr:polyketide synthase dehydratase domain-containing protein [Alicyclobacillus sp.]